MLFFRNRLVPEELKIHFPGYKDSVRLVRHFHQNALDIFTISINLLDMFIVLQKCNYNLELKAGYQGSPDR